MDQYMDIMDLLFEILLQKLFVEIVSAGGIWQK